MRNAGYYRPSDQSLAFSEKSHSLAVVHFVALDSGIGLGGVVNKSAPTFAQLSTTAHDVPDKELQRRRLVVPPRTDKSKNPILNLMTWTEVILRKALARAIDFGLVAFGLTLCVIAVMRTQQANLDRILQWQANLSHFQWVSVGLAVLITSYLAYWLSFLFLVGRTPGQFLTERHETPQTGSDTAQANPLIQKG